MHVDLIFPMLMLQNFWNVNYVERSSRTGTSLEEMGQESGDGRPRPNCQLPGSAAVKNVELNSFLWRIRSEPPSYLFGTIHVPYTKVWDWVPDNAKQAFRNAHAVFFELDLTQPATIAALTKCQLLPEEERLSDILPQELYRRLKRHLEYVKVMIPRWLTAAQRGRGLYPDYLFNAITGNWERKRPIWIMMMVNSLTRFDIQSRGVPVLDLYLAQEAERAGKRTGAVERVEEQCVPLNRLNSSQVVFALNQTLHQQENMRRGEVRPPYTTDDLIDHYKCGDLDQLVFERDTSYRDDDLGRDPGLRGNVTQQQQQRHPVTATGTVQQSEKSLSSSSQKPLSQAYSIDAYFREELIYVRNRRMAERVLQLLTASPNRTFFFAFGAGHFLGNHTVLDLLKHSGLVIDHIQPSAKIKRRKGSGKWRETGSAAQLLHDYPVSDSGRGNWLENHVAPSSGGQPGRRVTGRGTRGRGRGSHVVPTGQTTRKRRRKRRKRRRRKKKKHRNFNDLWIRLDSTSIRSYFEKPKSASLPPPGGHMAHYESLTTSSPSCRPHPQLSTILIVILLVFCS